jgi:hypothetical protein
MSPATFSDGFRGEGFGLTDEDAESNSYKTIAFIQKMIEDIGGDNLTLKVLGE